MKCVRYISTMMLAALLVLMTGLGGAAHALTNHCVSEHCDEQMSRMVAEHHVDHVSGDVTDRIPHGLEHSDCNSFLCSVFALMLTSFEAVFDPSETAFVWQVSSLSTLEAPDNPDRPPNL